MYRSGFVKTKNRDLLKIVKMTFLRFEACRLVSFKYRFDFFWANLGKLAGLSSKFSRHSPAGTQEKIEMIDRIDLSNRIQLEKS